MLPVLPPTKNNLATLFVALTSLNVDQRKIRNTFSNVCSNVAKHVSCTSLFSVLLQLFKIFLCYGLIELSSFFELLGALCSLLEL